MISLLAVSYTENGSQADTSCNHGGYQLECDGRIPEDTKISLPPVLPTMAGSMEQVCMRASVEIRQERNTIILGTL
jgi:hypothetical protein